MAKTKPKAKLGRPPAAVPLSVRVLVRLDRKSGDALTAYAKGSGIGSESTAARVLVIEGLKRGGLL